MPRQSGCGISVSSGSIRRFLRRGSIDPIRRGSLEGLSSASTCEGASPPCPPAGLAYPTHVPKSVARKARRIQNRVHEQRQRAAPEEAEVRLVGECDHLTSPVRFADEIRRAFH